jgi:hypothetical protein
MVWGFSGANIPVAPLPQPPLFYFSALATSRFPMCNRCFPFPGRHQNTSLHYCMERSRVFLVCLTTEHASCVASLGQCLYSHERDDDKGKIDHSAPRAYKHRQTHQTPAHPTNAFPHRGRARGREQAPKNDLQPAVRRQKPT